jgi:hypothetical protein
MVSDAVGFSFVAVGHWPTGQACPHRSAQNPLLSDMSQFMGQQVLTFTSPRRILPGSKNNVLPHGVSPGRYGTGGLGRSGIRVHAYRTEIVAKGSLHETARHWIERLPTVIDYRLNNRRNLIGGSELRRRSFDPAA